MARLCKLLSLLSRARKQAVIRGFCHGLPGWPKQLRQDGAYDLAFRWAQVKCAKWVKLDARRNRG